MKYFFFILFNIWIRPLSYLPLRVLYVLADVFYFILRYLLAYRKKIIYKNIQKAFPDFTEREKEELIKAYYHFLADLMAENVKGISISDKEIDKRVTYKGVDIMQKYADKKRNVTIMTGHNCNFEWMLMTINKFLPQDVYSFYVEISNPYFRKLILNNRTRNGLKLLQARDAGEFYRNKNIQNFANIFAADQSPSNVDKAEWTKFLHQPTAFLTGAYKYSKEKACSLVYMDIARVKRGYYEIRFSDMFENLENVSSELFLKRYVALLEQTIQNQPACWLWSHNRWKHKRG